MILAQKETAEQKKTRTQTNEEYLSNAVRYIPNYKPENKLLIPEMDYLKLNLKRDNYNVKRLKKKEERKVQARIRDAKRRESQAAAKIRKAENARRAAIKAAKEARPMSANKRRYLEDKKKQFLFPRDDFPNVVERWRKTQNKSLFLFFNNV